MNARGGTGCDPMATEEGVDLRIGDAVTLAAHDAATRDRARRSLRLLLDWTMFAPGAWSGSRLTMHGLPVEFAFDSGDQALRYCVEIADPCADAGMRLQQALAALRRVGADAIETQVLEQFANLQKGCALRFGAWVGGRHTATSDRYKLYVEVPPTQAARAHEWSERLAGPLTLPGGQRFRAGLIGYDIARRRLEFYYHARDLLPTAVPLLLRRVSMQRRAGELLCFLRRAYRFSHTGRLPSRDVGFSYSVPLDGGSTAFSIYFFCLSLFGGDGNARRRILQLASAEKWDLTRYDLLSRPLASVGGVPTRHGMLGLVLRHDRAMAVTVGLAPPERDDVRDDRPASGAYVAHGQVSTAGWL